MRKAVLEGWNFNVQKTGKVQDREGYKYYFYSNEHMPEHVHVKNGSGKAKFDISDGVQLVESKGMKVSELKRAQEIAEEEVQLLKEKWHEFFD